MTVNGPWRICFRFQKGDAYNVEIVDYLVTTSFLSALSKPCGAGPRAKSGEKEGQFRTKKSPKRCVERP